MCPFFPSPFTVVTLILATIISHLICSHSSPICSLSSLLNEVWFSQTVFHNVAGVILLKCKSDHSIYPPSLPQMSSFPSLLFYYYYYFLIKKNCLATLHGMWILVPGPGIEPAPPALEAWSVNQWTAREVPPITFIYLFILKHLYWSIIALQWCVSFCFITK